MPAQASYRFGDLTRGLARWLGPHARAVRGELDWLKFGQALVVAFMTGQAIGWGVLVAAVVGAVKDPQVAAAIPAVATTVAYVIEQVRRFAQDGRDARISTEQRDVQEEVR